MEIGGCFYNLIDKTFHTKTQRNSKKIRRVEREMTNEKNGNAYEKGFHFIIYRVS